MPYGDDIVFKAQSQSLIQRAAELLCPLRVWLDDSGYPVADRQREWDNERNQWLKDQKELMAR